MLWGSFLTGSYFVVELVRMTVGESRSRTGEEALEQQPS
jgi:hypothetical protein